MFHTFDKVNYQKFIGSFVATNIGANKIYHITNKNYIRTLLLENSVKMQKESEKRDDVDINRVLKPLFSKLNINSCNDKYKAFLCFVMGMLCTDKGVELLEEGCTEISE